MRVYLESPEYREPGEGNGYPVPDSTLDDEETGMKSGGVSLPKSMDFLRLSTSSTVRANVGVEPYRSESSMLSIAVERALNSVGKLEVLLC